MRSRGNHDRLVSHYSMVFFVVIAAILAANPSADAGSASSALGVTVRVVRSCRISTTLPPLGNADFIAANANVDGTAAASVAVGCARAATPAIAISAGSRTAGSAATQVVSMIDSEVDYKTHKGAVTMPIRQGMSGEALSLGIAGSGPTETIPVYRRAAEIRNAPAQKDPGLTVVEVNF